jgi:hypothetical protein
MNRTIRISIRGRIIMAYLLVTIALLWVGPSMAQGYGIYDNRTGQFLGNVNSSKIDPNSISNPWGRYGSRWSPDSINNPYNMNSPRNPYNPTNSGYQVPSTPGVDTSMYRLY